MRGRARMRLAGGGALVLPFETPYEYQMLFDQVGDYARRHGRVHLELNTRAWTVSVGGKGGRACDACGQRLTQVTYALQRRNFCPACVQRHESHGTGALANRVPRRPQADRTQGNQ